ncbi:hypothetical protein SAMN05421847_2820 [Halpernia humi]|uniref:Uncharacterized protein n=1 Tax=Halpernia humi TaxID=493375 RepID=A0A1H6BA80_9FLAO|nr:hypothetical protein SAMN05421847_2820 [Halpernia humi]
MSANQLEIKKQNIDVKSCISINLKNSRQVKGLLTNSETFFVDISTGECYQRTCRTVSTSNGDGSTTEYKIVVIG